MRKNIFIPRVVEFRKRTLGYTGRIIHKFLKPDLFRYKWLTFIAMNLIINIAFAQDAETRRPQLTPEERAEKATSHLQKQLSLSADQAAQVKQVYLNHAKKEQNDLEKKKEMRAQLNEDLAKVLSPEQMEKLKQMQQERKQRMIEHRKQKTPADPVPPVEENNK